MQRREAPRRLWQCGSRHHRASACHNERPAGIRPRRCSTTGAPTHHTLRTFVSSTLPSPLLPLRSSFSPPFPPPSSDAGGTRPAASPSPSCVPACTVTHTQDTNEPLAALPVGLWGLLVGCGSAVQGCPGSAPARPRLGPCAAQLSRRHERWLLGKLQLGEVRREHWGGAHKQNKAGGVVRAPRGCAAGRAAAAPACLAGRVGRWGPAASPLAASRWQRAA